MENLEIEELEQKKIYSGSTYPEVLTKKYNYIYYKYVPFILDEIKQNDIIIYTWQYVKLPVYNYNYDKLVEVLIELKYSNGEVIARLNNYISEPNNAKYKKEYEELTYWRNKVKAFAKKHFNLV